MTLEENLRKIDELALKGQNLNDNPYEDDLEYVKGYKIPIAVNYRSAKRDFYKMLEQIKMILPLLDYQPDNIYFIEYKDSKPRFILEFNYKIRELIFNGSHYYIDRYRHLQLKMTELYCLEIEDEENVQFDYEYYINDFNKNDKSIKRINERLNPYEIQ